MPAPKAHSLTELSQWDFCPWSYKLKYEDKVKVKKPVELLTGTILHKVMSSLWNFKEGRPTYVSPDSIEKYVFGNFERWVQEEGGDEWIDWTSLGLRGLKLLGQIGETAASLHKRYAVDEFQNRNNPPLAVEETIPFTFGDRRFTVKPDAIFKGFVVVNYKTGQHILAKNKAVREWADLEHLMLAIAISEKLEADTQGFNEMFQYSPSDASIEGILNELRFEYHGLRKKGGDHTLNKLVHEPPKNMAPEVLISRVETIEAAVSESNFPPNLYNCGRCSFFTKCKFHNPSIEIGERPRQLSLISPSELALKQYAAAGTRNSWRKPGAPKPRRKRFKQASLELEA